MKISKLAIKSVFVAAVLALTACASMGDGTVAEKRQAILDMQEMRWLAYTPRSQTLALRQETQRGICRIYQRQHKCFLCGGGHRLRRCKQ